MECLPDEIIKNIVSYASPFDNIAMSNTSKTLHSQLSLTATSPIHVLSEVSKSKFQIPRFQDPIHSIVITLKWQDFRRRSRRGKLSVLDEEGNYVHSVDVDLRTNRRIIRIMFAPKQNESYSLEHSFCGGDATVQVKEQTLSFGENVFSGNSHHYLVKITTGICPQLLDEAMGRVNEMGDHPLDPGLTNYDSDSSI